MTTSKYLADALRRRMERETADGKEDAAALTRVRLEAFEQEQSGDLSSLSKPELVERAEKAGVDSSGTKADIIERLQASEG